VASISSEILLQDQSLYINALLKMWLGYIILRGSFLSYKRLMASPIWGIRLFGSFLILSALSDIFSFRILHYTVLQIILGCTVIAVILVDGRRWRAKHTNSGNDETARDKDADSSTDAFPTDIIAVSVVFVVATVLVAME